METATTYTKFTIRLSSKESYEILIWRKNQQKSLQEEELLLPPQLTKTLEE